MIEAIILCAILIAWQAPNGYHWALSDNLAFWQGIKQHGRIRSYLFLFVLSLAGTGMVASTSNQPIDFTLTGEGVVYLLGWSCLLLAAFHDIKQQLLPDRLLFMAMVFFGLYIALYQPEGYAYHLESALLGYALFWSLNLAGVFVDRSLIGMGDVKLLAVLMFVVGYEHLGLTLMLSALYYFVGYAIESDVFKKEIERIAYGPPLVVGALVALML
jgi:prepilin signal peptidase PulO-like enzyme (type II secretory pathway)